MIPNQTGQPPPSANRKQPAEDGLAHLLPNQQCVASKATAAFINQCCYILMFLQMANTFLMIAPADQVLETALCRRPRRDSPGHTCKGDDVQTELAHIKGFLSTYEALASAFVAIIYGWWADRDGQRKPMCITLSCMVLSRIYEMVIYAQANTFDFRWLWLRSILSLAGGGQLAYISLLYSAVGRAVPKDDKTQPYFWLSISALLGQILGNFGASLLLNINPWVPMCCALGLLVISFVPHSRLPKKQPQASMSPGHQSLPVRLESLKVKCYLALFLLANTLTSPGLYFFDILQQYTAKRFDWAWAIAALATGGYSVMQLIFFILFTSLVLPHVERRGLLLYGSGLLLMIGTVVMGLPGSMKMLIIGFAFYLLGSAFETLLRSAVIALGGAESAALLNTAFSLSQSLGVVLYGVLLSELRGLGVKWGDAWNGLPFLVLGLTHLGASILGAVVLTCWPPQNKKTVGLTP